MSDRLISAINRALGFTDDRWEPIVGEKLIVRKMSLPRKDVFDTVKRITTDYIILVSGRKFRKKDYVEVGSKFGFEYKLIEV